jgi:hypothetical protein
MRNQTSTKPMEWTGYPHVLSCFDGFLPATQGQRLGTP